MSTETKSTWKADYHKQSDFQFQAGKKAIDNFGLKGDERILDVGCGTGRTTNYCAQKLTTGSVVGIDFSEEMIRFAKEEYKDTPNLTFQQGGATQLPFNSEFDVVYSMYCLHWVQDQETAIQKIAQSLKPGGRALLYIPFESVLSKNYETCIASILQDRPEWKGRTEKNYYLQLEDTWLAWCGKAGLGMKSHRIINQSKTFATLSDCKKYLKALDIVPNLSDAERDEFLGLVMRKVYGIYGVGENEPFEFITATLILELKLDA